MSFLRLQSSSYSSCHPEQLCDSPRSPSPPQRWVSSSVYHHGEREGPKQHHLLMRCIGKCGWTPPHTHFYPQTLLKVTSTQRMWQSPNSAPVFFAAWQTTTNLKGLTSQPFPCISQFCVPGIRAGLDRGVSWLPLVWTSHSVALSWQLAWPGESKTACSHTWCLHRDSWKVMLSYALFVSGIFRHLHSVSPTR